MPSEPPGDPAEGPTADPPTESPPGPPGGWPLWKQIRNELARAILRRVFRPEEKIPSIRKLRGEYGCGAALVQTAIRDLQAAGFVAPSRTGSPWRVHKEPPNSWPMDWEPPPPGWL